MTPCAYCARPLLCDACADPYDPATEAEYHALSWRDAPVRCHSCGLIVACRWCKMPYDGRGDEGDDGDAAEP